MDEVVIQDESDTQLLSYVILFFLFVTVLLVLGITRHGFTPAYMISIVILFIAGLFTMLYYKNHTVILRISSTGISCDETSPLRKKTRKKWGFDFAEVSQVILENSQTSVGRRGNRTECIQISVFLTSGHSVKRIVIARMDLHTKSKIESLAIKYGLNLKIV